MPRLAGCLDSAPEGEVAVEADFSLDAARRPVIGGHAAAVVRLTCQRCLEPVDWPLEASFTLAVVQDESEAAALPAEYEPLLCPEGSGSLPGMIEDELLLALPAVARHRDVSECGPAAGFARPGNGDETRLDDNPFAVLEQLKRKEK